METYYFGLRENGLKGSVKVLVTFKVDEISMLIIRAKEKGINNEINNKFNFDKHRKNEQKISIKHIHITKKKIQIINLKAILILPQLLGIIKDLKMRILNLIVLFFNFIYKNIFYCFFD